MIDQKRSGRHASRRTGRRARALGICLVLGCLALAGTATAQAPSEEQPEQFVALMNDYLEFTQRWVELADKPRSAVHLAVEGIVELHVERGEPDKAVERLEQIAKEFEDSRVVVTLVRFKLRDLYKEMGQTQRALEQLELILKEHS